MNAETIQYELDLFDTYPGDYDDLEIDEDGPIWVDVYIYGSYANGPKYPKKYRIIMYNQTFISGEHSLFEDVIDNVPLERWAYTSGWSPITSTTATPVKLRFEGEFIILRVADHPGGTNAHCIGLKELMDYLNVTLWGKGLPAPMRLHPDDLCPADATDFLNLPVRCRCGVEYPKVDGRQHGDWICDWECPDTWFINT